MLSTKEVKLLMKSPTQRHFGVSGPQGSVKGFHIKAAVEGSSPTGRMTIRLSPW